MTWGGDPVEELPTPNLALQQTGAACRLSVTTARWVRPRLLNLG
jgi:hypothetical protein